jgi:hypothetical protein
LTVILLSSENSATLFKTKWQQDSSNYMFSTETDFDWLRIYLPR